MSPAILTAVQLFQAIGILKPMITFVSTMFGMIVLYVGFRYFQKS